MTFWSATLCGVLLVVGLTGCGGAESYRPEVRYDSTNTKAKSIVELADERRDLTKFVAAVEAAQLRETLEGTGPFTVFAPNNSAFVGVSLEADSLAGGRQGRDSLQQPAPLFSEAHRDTLGVLLAYHVVRGRLRASQVIDSLRVATLLDEPLLLRRGATEASFTVNGLTVVESLPARNGVLYVLGSVLAIPEPDTTAMGELQPAASAATQ